MPCNQSPRHKNRPRPLLIATMLTVLLAPIFPATADTRPEINFDQSNPPFAFEENQTLKGIYPAIVKAVFDRMGTPVELSAMPWTRALRQTDEGKTGIAGLYKNKSRQERYDYSNPIYTETLKLYTLKNKSFPYNSLEDLAGKTIGVVRGWSYGDLFDSAKDAKLFKTVPANDDYTNIQKLLKGQIEVIVAIPETIKTIAKEKNIEFEIAEIPTPIISNPTHIAFNKAAQKKDLLEQFNRALEDIKQEGVYEKIKNQTSDSK